jgi:hypothetical protein
MIMNTFVKLYIENNSFINSNSGLFKLKIWLNNDKTFLEKWNNIIKCEFFSLRPYPNVSYEHLKGQNLKT